MRSCGLGVRISAVSKNEDGFAVVTDQGEFRGTLAGGRDRRAFDPENGIERVRL